MIQPIALQRARIPVIALGAFALGAFAAASLPKVNAPTAPQSIVIQAPSTLAQRAIVQPKSTSSVCGSGAYVSGDVAGDASPAQIYSNMCGSR